MAIELLVFFMYFSLLTRESIGKEAELEMKLAIVSNALMKVCKKLTIAFLQELKCQQIKRDRQSLVGWRERESE